jgi:transposase-like protein
MIMDDCIYCNSSEIEKNSRTKSSDQEYYCRRCKSYFTLSSNPNYHRSRKGATRFFKKTLKLMIIKPERIYMDANNAYRFIENFEYIRGYVGGTNISNRKTRFETWNKVQFLVDKKTS